MSGETHVNKQYSLIHPIHTGTSEAKLGLVFSWVNKQRGKFSGHMSVTWLLSYSFSGVTGTNELCGLWTILLTIEISYCRESPDMPL